MITRYNVAHLTWIDAESPTPDEVRSLMDEFSLHPSVGEGLLLPSRRSEIEKYDDHIYVVLHFPAFKHTHGNAAVQEIDFVAGKEYVITVRYETIDVLHEFAKITEANTLVQNGHKAPNAGFLLYHLLRRLYRGMSEEREAFTDELSEIEERIFAGEERHMVEEVSRAARKGLLAKRILRSHTPTIAALGHVGTELYGKTFTPMGAMLALEHSRLYSDIEAYIEQISELRETNNTLVSTKQNEIVKNLTVMAFMTFPLALIASIFALPTHVKPIIGQENDFWVILGIMAGIAILFYSYFQRKNWL